MNRLDKLYTSFSAFTGLTLLMLWGLFRSVLPVFQEHQASMLIGVLGYVLLVFLILSSEWKKRKVHLAAGGMSVLLIGLHLLLEMSLIASVRFPELINPFGYSALAAFLTASAIKGLSMIDQWQKLRQYVHGVLMLGIGFVYWHVASIGIIATSWLFFIPFTALLVWSLIHFASVIVLQKNCIRLSD